MKKLWVFITIWIIGIGIYGFIAVSNNAKQAANTLATCYHGHVGDSDSVFTVESQSGEVIKGKMSFVFAQKDSSYGTYVGTFADGQLKATYTFWSEGVQSVGDYLFTKSGKNFTGSGYTYLPESDCEKYLTRT